VHSLWAEIPLGNSIPNSLIRPLWCYDHSIKSENEPLITRGS